MTTWQVVVLIVVIIAVVAVAVIALRANRRTKQLRARFGPEYNRAVAEAGNKQKAEAKLDKIERRVSRYSIRPLSPADRDRFQQSWRQVQAKFVDDPQLTLGDADQLLGEVMAARGYPVVDFNRQAEELAVDHAMVVDHYRAGHDIAVRQVQGRATTEELRQAMIHYRTLFDDLIGAAPETAKARAAGGV